MNDTLINDLLTHWFSDEVSPLWFKSTDEFDAELTQRYELIWQQARDGLLDHWKTSAEGVVALVIILDQLPLNMFRGQGKRYSTEAKSRDIAHYAIDHDLIKAMPDKHKAFLFLPFMHSENLNDQQLAIELFEAAGLDDNAKFARHHYDVVKRFGRFPHRNGELGRESTPDEIAYLKTSNW